MSEKKFVSNVRAKGNLQVDQLFKLPSVTTEQALIVNANGEVTQGGVTSEELGRLSGVTADIQTQLDAKIDSAEKGAANGVATLDANQKIPAAQLPAIAIADVFAVADIAARDALVVGPNDGEVQEGDVVRVADASADGINGPASYIYDGTQYLQLKSDDSVDTVNGQTGDVVLTTTEIAEGTNLYFTDERAQDAIGNALVDSASVDFTYDDVANTVTADVLPAGVDHDQLLNFVANEHVDHSTVEIATAADSGLAGGGDITATRNLTVDITNTTELATGQLAPEDEFLIYDVSAAALRKVSRAEIVGAGAASAGDIAETSATLLNNQTTAQNVTGLVFDPLVVRSFEAQISVEIDATADLFEVFRLQGINKGGSFEMSIESTGDESGIVLTIVPSTGQVQYTSQDQAGFVSSRAAFRATTTTVA